MASLKLSEYRPCRVNKQKAIFHRWIEKDDTILKLNISVKEDVYRDLIVAQDTNLPIPNGVDVIVTRNTYGLVEYASGKIHLVEPTEIKFLDSKKMAYEAGLMEDSNNG